MTAAVNDDPPNWIGYLDNRVALQNTFGGTVPVLDGLMLAQLVIEQTGGMFISLNFPALPEASPARWIAAGCDRLQLRLSFHDLAHLSIKGLECDGNLEVCASFGPGKRFSISHPDFMVEFEYGHVNAGCYPYDSRIFEEPRDWYHR